MIAAKEKIEFTEEELKEIEKIKAKYPDTQSALMPVLWLAQKKWKWLSGDVQHYVGEVLGLPYAAVHGVVTFYTMFFEKPMGKYHIQVCTNVSCMLTGGEEIFQHVSEKLGIGNMEVTSDGLFSLEEVECMGACGGAPMIAVNEDYYENTSIAEVDKLLDSLK